ncbi:hypothetical protein EPN87_03905 [archaeon]|nr:MAG: hypothetical protein EPN87_03905 [archaeon]
MSLKKLIVFTILPFLFSTPSALAHCPLCTAATAAAIAFTRWYGLDDSIMGVFVGGMIIATGLWANNMLKRFNKGKEYLPLQSVILVILSAIFTIIPFYYAGLVGPLNPFRIFGIDRILFGAIIGIAVYFLSFRLHGIIRTSNKNRNYFPYQSIALLISLLSLSAFALYLVM